MAELTQQQVEQMERLAAAAQTAAVAMDANSKSQKSQFRIDLEHQLAIQNLTKEIRKATGASKEEATLKARAIKAQEDEIKATEQKIKLEDDASQNLVTGVRKFTGEIGRFAQSTLSASQSIYNSNKSFTAVLPTLQLVSDTVSTVIEAIGKGFSGVGVEVAGFGFNTGRASEAIAGFVDAGSKLAFAQAKLQIENAQKFIDTYQELSKVGMSFGGQIEDMRQTALSGGLALDSFQRYVAASSQQLTLLGGNIQTGAERALKFGTTLAQQNPKLLAMYGSFDALQSATTDYMALQASYGIDVSNMTKEQTASAKDYLVNMKELSAITGKSTDALKKEQEERNRNAAFQHAMAGKTSQDKINTERALEVIRSKKGEDAYKYAMETIATNGNITSTAGLQFQGMLGETAETVRDMLSVTDQSKETYNAQEAQILKDRLGAEQRQADAYNQSYTKLYGALGSDPLFQSISGTTAAFIRNKTSIEDMTYANAKAAEDFNKPMSASTTAFTQTLKDLETYKIRMDAITESQLGRIGGIVDKLFQLQTNLDNLFGTDSALGTALGVFTGGLISASNALAQFAGGGKQTAGGNSSGTPESRIAGNQAVMNNATGGKGFSGKISSWLAAAGAGAANESELGIGATGGNIDYGNLQFKNKAEGTGGGNVDAQIIRAAQIISNKYDGTVVNGFNDLEHWKPEHKTSKHRIGAAADLRVPGFDKPGTMDAINSLISGLGVSAAIHNGNHVHLEEMQKANGGTVGSGQTAIVGEKGAELVNGPASVTSTASTSQIFNNMLDKLDEMVDVLKDNRDYSEKILHATQ